VTRTRRTHPLRRAVTAATAGVAVLAVVQQLARPRADRTWNGRVVGVPYDFRPPTLERVRQRLWAPEDPHLLVPRVFGVGWTVNVARLVRLLAA
jgi:hypothetical protein